MCYLRKSSGAKLAKIFCKKLPKIKLLTLNKNA